MTQTLESRHLGMRIGKPFEEVYDFLAVPENFPRWASGLGSSLEKADGEWIAEGPDGPVRVRFSERNAFGILDHEVTTGAGERILIPLRLIRNGGGCEIVLTLFRNPGTGDEAYERDAGWVMRDLRALKALMENLSPEG